MAEHTFTVEVVYAGPKSSIQRRRVELREGSTVMHAIEACGITLSLPVGAIDPTCLGIFGRKVAPDQLVRSGDRIEIYRPLALDPKEARRRRTR
ncbi:RnfH family protein [Rhodanobacter sp. B05]|uniref:RnfH family protein n=1 Tax=Rhodanobacter sp. B05 TaxID=1945859 RepID=UPI0009875547|nr:RnfH family protein [Rhodanobacter sp. B05]OOG52455.1 RnfH family protein [Rhodanobacter sp. B05]